MNHFSDDGNEGKGAGRAGKAASSGLIRESAGLVAATACPVSTWARSPRRWPGRPGVPTMRFHGFGTAKCDNGNSNRSAVWVMSESLWTTDDDTIQLISPPTTDPPDNQPAAGTASSTCEQEREVNYRWKLPKGPLLVPARVRTNVSE